MKIRSKKEIEESKQKRNKVLKILKRILDCLIYTWAVVLTICLMVGSCSSKNDGSKKQQLNKARNDTDLQYVYVTQNSGNKTMSFDWLQNFTTYYGYGGGQSSSAPEVWINDTLDDGDYYLYYNDEFKKVSYWNIRLNIYQYIANAFYMYFPDVTLYFEDGSYIYYATKVDQTYQSGNDFRYNFNSSLYLVTSNASTNDYILYSYFDKNLTSNQVFRFIPSINYYYWANVNRGNKFDDNLDIIYDSVFNDQSWYQITINTGFFISNNQMFNQITLNYYNLYYDGGGRGLDWQLDDGSVGSVTPTAGYGYFAFMRYQNSFNSSYVDVYSRNLAVIYDSNNDVPQHVLTNGCSWVNNAYQTLNFVENIDTNGNAYNILINLNNYSYHDYNGDILDVFGLFKTAFTNIIPFLNISVIPGFTIGMLLCMPLAVTLIIVIVRLVKK